MCKVCLQASRNPFNCIVPPHMLKVLSMRGSGAVAEMARSMLKQDAKTRDERSELSGNPLVALPSVAGGMFVSSAIATAPNDITLRRDIFDGQNKAALPGKPVRGEGDPESEDPDVNKAYDGAGEVHSLYAKEFGRNSIDGKGMTLIATVHHRKNYGNAFWDGTQMAYGDGDGDIFTNFTEISVIGHEMSHGVVQHSGGLIYQGQSGALNESFADVFGSLTKQYKLRQDACEADWLIGEGILGPSVRGLALRSMRAPGTAYADGTLGSDPQPYHMDMFVQTNDDNGGVHINSGIPNHAFYLFSVLLGGKAWEKPGQIWYRALQRINNPLATFGDWAAQTLDASIELHGVGSFEMVMLRRAWKLVGIAI